MFKDQPSNDKTNTNSPSDFTKLTPTYSITVYHQKKQQLGILAFPMLSNFDWRRGTTRHSTQCDAAAHICNDNLRGDERFKNRPSMSQDGANSQWRLKITVSRHEPSVGRYFLPHKHSLNTILSYSEACCIYPLRRTANLYFSVAASYRPLRYKAEEAAQCPLNRSKINVISWHVMSLSHYRTPPQKKKTCKNFFLHGFGSLRSFQQGKTTTKWH